MNLVNSNSYLKCESLVQGDIVCMVNLSLETWTEISMEEMFLEWQTIKKKKVRVMTMWKGILVALVMNCRDTSTPH